MNWLIIRVAKVEDVVKVGDEITVKVIDIDHMGRVNLSRKAMFEKPGEERQRTPRPEQEAIPREGRCEVAGKASAVLKKDDNI